MKTKFWAIASVLLFSIHAEAKMSSNSTPWNQLNQKLEKELPAGKSAVYSPLSVWTAMAMVEAGADKETKVELRRALNLGDLSSKSIGETLRAIGKSKHHQIAFANAAWPEKKLQLRKEFVSEQKTNFDAEIESLNYASDAEGARGKVNEWVARKTNSRIKDILPPNSVDNLTVLVLTNAIYFKAKWASPFESQKTKPAPFFVTPAKKIDVPTMHGFEFHSYFEDKNQQVLQMNYASGADMPEMSFLVVLPRKDDGLKSEGTAPETLLAKVSPQYVHVSLPRFKVEYAFPEMKRVLQKAGIHLAFDRDKSQLDKMFNEKIPIFVSDVFHKSMIEVTEEGTEAAAATAAVMSVRGMAPKAPVKFTANRPFRFYIIHNATKSVLFAGRYFGN